MVLRAEIGRREKIKFFLIKALFPKKSDLKIYQLRY